jgi:hypothetical protein
MKPWELYLSDEEKGELVLMRAQFERLRQEYLKAKSDFERSADRLSVKCRAYKKQYDPSPL